MRYPKGMSLIETDNLLISVLYQTEIVKIKDKRLKLRSGGWYTNHTKKCINLVLSKYEIPYYLRQVKGQWLLESQNGTSIEFTDGMEVLL